MHDTIDIERLAAAAKERSAAVATRSARPSQRRSAEPLGSGFGITVRAKTEIRAVGDEDNARLNFHGLASAYETGYAMFDFWGEYTEVVEAGAGAKSLAQAGLDVPLVLQHAQLRRIARTNNEESPLFLQETDAGLEVDAPSLDPNDVDVAYIAPKIRSLLIDEMSFAFRIIRGVWSPDWTTYRIQEFDIHRGDVAIVGYGANPYTSSDLRTPAPAAEPAKRGSDLVSIDELSPRRLLR